MAVDDKAKVQPVADVYPAECHFSIIAEPGGGVREAVSGVLAGYETTSAIRDGGATPSRRHRALRVSVRVRSRDELENLDQALRAVPGVRMIL